jgi:hypothetical protein
VLACAAHKRRGTAGICSLIARHRRARECGVRTRRAARDESPLILLNGL